MSSVSALARAMVNSHFRKCFIGRPRVGMNGGCLRHDRILYEHGRASFNEIGTLAAQADRERCVSHLESHNRAFAHRISGSLGPGAQTASTSTMAFYRNSGLASLKQRSEALPAPNAHCHDAVSTTRSLQLPNQQSGHSRPGHAQTFEELRNRKDSSEVQTTARERESYAPFIQFQSRSRSRPDARRRPSGAGAGVYARPC